MIAVRKPLAVIILAAGKGTRMKSSLVKVLHPLVGAPLLSYSLQLARRLQPQRLVVVVGAQQELVRDKFQAPDLIFVNQKEQLGTGHAVICAAEELRDYRGTVLILCADVPLLTEETVRKFLESHETQKATVSVLTTRLKDPRGYGRILRERDGVPRRIVEDKDRLGEEGEIHEINTGIYCVEGEFLFPALSSLSNQNVQREYYLTDIVEKAASQGKKTLAVLTENSLEVLGINTRVDLARTAQEVRARIAEEHMLAGVTLIDPRVTYIDRGVTIGQDTVLYPNCFLLGKTSLGEGCIVEAGCKITDSRIGDHVTIKTSSVITESIIENHVEVGPLAHLRPESILRERSKVGNFVELKKSVLGKGTKANHLSYIGDTTVGEKANIGAGTITCNYDGRKKHPTIMEDGVFIGSNTALVAPVKIGRQAYVGAGSTITKEVPPNTLAVTRARQVHYKKRTHREE